MILSIQITAACFNSISRSEAIKTDFQFLDTSNSVTDREGFKLCECMKNTMGMISWQSLVQRFAKVIFSTACDFFNIDRSTLNDIR